MSINSSIVVTVNDIEQKVDKDYKIINEKLIFNIPPEPNSKILVKQLKEEKNGKTNN